MMDRTTLSQARALYAGAPWRDRLHVALRLTLCPFVDLAAYVPPAGKIVDLGCGHGVFAHALALGSPQRCVIGVDPDARKLRVARAVLETRRVQFVQGDASENPTSGPCEAFVLIDVLYLLPARYQERVLRACHDRLSPGGVLLLKTMDDRPRWKAALNYAEEWLAVNAGLTYRVASSFAFRPLAEWAALCREIGFQTRVVRLDRGYYQPHGAIVGVRP